MARRGKPPGGNGRGTHWTTDRVEVGSKNEGWIAGPLHVIDCHQRKGSKPCRKLLLGESATCAGCASHIPITELGYLPLYRGDGKPVVVCVQEHSFDLIDPLPLHARVSWGRREGDGESVWVQRLLSGPSWYTTLPEKRLPANITEHLLRIWEMPDLRAAVTALFATDCQPADTAPLPAALSPADDGVNEPPADSDFARAARESQAVRGVLPVGLPPVGDVIHQRNGSAKKRH